MKEETVLKGKKTFKKVIFSRTLVTVVLIFFQFSFLFILYFWLREYAYPIAEIIAAISLVLIIYIVNKEQTAEYKIAWIIPISLLPVFGGLLYLFVKLNLGYRRLKKNSLKIENETRNIITTKKEVKEKLKKENQNVAGLASYIEKNGTYPVFQNTETAYFSSGEEKFSAMITELERAQNFIFLEYFIIEQGYMWETILEILKRKAQQGVEVRVMYDGMCSLTLLPYNYPKLINRYGIKSKMFSPIKPFFSTEQNNRDHRKILVIDGKVAFNGGINIGDGYINKKTVYGHWKDTAVLLRGEAVDSFTLMFLQMWNIGETEKEKYSEYFGLYDNYSSESYIIPYGDGPTNDIEIAKNIYLNIINTARNYVYIMTPYLILDHDFIVALVFAAERGVDVRIIIPGIPDKKIPYMIAHTFLPQLIRGGVRIYKYSPGFVHAKNFISDDESAVVGTINLDYRSLYLHYECATYIYKDPVINKIKKDFIETFEKCSEYKLSDYYKVRKTKRLIGRIFRIFGPLM